MFVGMMVALVYGSSMVVGQGSRQATEDRHRWNATELGSMIMEELAFSYMSAGQLDEGQHVRYYDQEYGIVAPNSLTHFYTVEWTVRENDPLQGISNIQLAVKWNEGPYGKVVTFQTYR